MAGSKLPHKLRQTLQEEKDAIGFLLGIEHELAFHTGAQFRGLTLKQQENGCLLVLRAIHRGRPVVAFFGGGSVLKCLQHMFVTVTEINVPWRPDKYAKR